MNTAQHVLQSDLLPSATRLRDLLLRIRRGLTWRRAGTVLLLCLILSTQIFAQPGLLELWSLAQVAEGWAFYFIELALTSFAMLVGFALAETLWGRSGRQHAIAVGVALPIAAALGYGLAVTLLYSQNFSIVSFHYVGDTLRMTVLGGATALIYMLRRSAETAAKATHETKVAREGLARQTVEARLQLMEAQIEPHFLFNSLANVQRLYETDPASGERLLQNLKTYLRAALPQMRDAHATLGREAELSRAYLEVLRARMGDRLAFSIDISPDLRAHAFPSMMLITLVENAIKHGIHHSPLGGAIAVRARRDGERLVVEVADTGVGFKSGSGKGIGLANIRARLAAQFGDRGELSLRNNEPCGIVAAIAIPTRGDRS